MHTVLSSRQITHSKLSSKHMSLTHKEKAESEGNLIFTCTKNTTVVKTHVYLGLKWKPPTFASTPHNCRKRFSGAFRFENEEPATFDALCHTTMEKPRLMYLGS